MSEINKAQVHVSICSSGSRFFWCVVGDAADEVIAYGRTLTLADAEKKIWSQSAIHRNGHNVVRLDESLAKRIRRDVRNSDCRHIGRYLYTYHQEPDGSIKSVSHSIVGRTRHYISVKLDSGDIRLKRRILNHNGLFRIEKVWYRFHMVPFDEWTATGKANYHDWDEEFERLQRSSLTVFPENERRSAFSYLHKRRLLITDETLLEVCIHRRLNDLRYELGA